MKNLTFAVVLICTPMLAQAWPWSHDMANQISIKSQGSPGFLHNRTPTLNADPGMRIMPTRSVPVPAVAATLMPNREIAEATMKNPIPATAKSIKTGKQLFDILCTPCHGFEGRGDGEVGNRFVLQPFDLTSDEVKARSDAFIWSQMTFGGVFMPTYANDLSPEERWHVLNYVRQVLQKLPKTPVASAN
ncbi:MAG: cytochrome c [Candidatus Nitrotoga sp.]